MPFSILQYSAVNTKARVLAGRLLSQEDYMSLLARRSVPEVAAYLKKNTVYSGILADINESIVHRGELEILFGTSLYGDFVKMRRFLRGDSRKFMEAAFLRYEAEDLKTLLRVVYTGRDKQQVQDSLVFLKKYSALDSEALLNSKSLSDFIGSLKGSVYYKVLSPFLDSRENRNLFDMEMALDLHFFMMIQKEKDRLLSGGDWKSVTRSFGIEVDILNILMIYRCKKLFNLSKEEIIRFIIPYRYRLTREQLVQLSKSRDMDEFKSLVSKTKYARIFKAGEERFWEFNSMNYKFDIYKSYLRRESFNLGTTMAYIHLKEIDIKNIITLIEGIRYHLPGEEIKSYLIGMNR